MRCGAALFGEESRPLTHTCPNSSCSVCVCVCTFVCEFVCMQACACVCVCVCVHACAYGCVNCHWVIHI